MNTNYNLYIFDLDGTLLDTSMGIFNSVRYAEKCMGFIPIEESKLKEFVGPPPKVMYMRIYGVEESIALEATKKHREYGRTEGIFEAIVYPGIAETLRKLKQRGHKLAVATLKNQKIAESILKNFNLYKYFDVVIGMNDEESLTKCQTIQLAMQHTNIRDNVVMIGDSEYDFDGAKQAGVDFIGVLYGFGFKQQQEKVVFVEDIKDLLS